MSTQQHRDDREIADTVISLKNLSEDLHEISLLLTGKTRDSYLDHEIVAMKAVRRTLKYRIDMLEKVMGQFAPALDDMPF